MFDLSPWPGATVVRHLGGGNRNTVAEIRGPHRLVARRSTRAPAALDWELDLLDFLAQHDFHVPRTVPTADGRRSANGVVVQTWLDGHPPEGDDWQLVARHLTRLHALTAHWPQRPGFASTRQLLEQDSGGDVDLTSMPADAVALCRSAWRALARITTAVIHGDPGAPNIRMSNGRVGFLDWDEARVDHIDLDMADLPDSPLSADRLRTAQAAADAWEAATGWQTEPSYARRRLSALRIRQ